MRWPKYWRFSFSIIPSKEHPGLVSFRMDWLDLLAVQGTLKSLLQHHSSKASILQCSVFFIVQFSYPHMTTGKTLAFTRWIFVDEVTFLLCNMLSRLVITFLPRSNCLLISWLQSLSAVILEPKKRKSVTASTFLLLFAMKWCDQIPWSELFECLALSQLFHSPLLLSSRGFLIPIHFLPLDWYHLHIWGWYFSRNLDSNLWFIQPGISHDVHPI